MLRKPRAQYYDSHPVHSGTSSLVSRGRYAYSTEIMIEALGSASDTKDSEFGRSASCCEVHKSSAELTNLFDRSESSLIPLQ